MMTPEQRYFFDVAGYLHLQNALSDAELAAGRAATQRYIDTPPDELPPGFGVEGKRHINGFAFDKSLEALVFHPKTWPIVKEFTNGKPRFMSGTLQVDFPGAEGGRLHCARDDYGWESCRYETRDGGIYCDNFVIFPYFDDVFPGDGGLLVVPGSHKASFHRPPEAFNGGDIKDLSNLPAGVVNLTPRAGDMLIISELLTHGVLPWTPKDRIRRILVLRYQQQYGRRGGAPEVLKERLSPETLELMEYAHHTETKELSKREVVTLS
jgi:ectoine hydroxylase-related dioxygenase (phytanoyl-CoA dioxygenase family)